MVRKRIRSIRKKRKSFRPKKAARDRFPKIPEGMTFVGLPVIVIGFVLVGYGLLSSNGIAPLAAAVVFLAGLVFVWKR